MRVGRGMGVCAHFEDRGVQERDLSGLFMVLHILLINAPYDCLRHYWWSF